MTSKWASLPRRRLTREGLRPREDRFIAGLLTKFPGSEWVEDVITPATPGEPPSASTLSEGSTPRKSLDTLPPGGTGALYVVIGSEYDKPKLRKWAEALPPGTDVMCGSPYRSKTGIPLNGEALLMDAYPATRELEWGQDYLGDNFRFLQAGLIASQAAVDSATLVLIGKGKKVDAAISVVDHLGSSSVATLVVDAAPRPKAGGGGATAGKPSPVAA